MTRHGNPPPRRALPSEPSYLMDLHLRKSVHGSLLQGSRLFDAGFVFAVHPWRRDRVYAAGMGYPYDHGYLE